MMKAFFVLRILKINALSSAFATTVVVTLTPMPVFGVIQALSLSLVTVGFVMTVFLHRSWYRSEFVLLQNFGVEESTINLLGYLASLLLAALLTTVALIVDAS